MPNPSKLLYLLADIQKHIYNGTIQHELSQIARHTRDQEILNTCDRAAEYLGIEIDSTFKKFDENQLVHSRKVLVNHLTWATERFNEVVKLKDTCDPKWISSPYDATEYQLLMLSDCYTLLDKVPDTTDANGEVIKVGDLVAVLCQDEEGKDYEHYGVVVHSSKGFRVAHFFTGTTVKAQNNISEKGFGYIHEADYEPKWIVKEHLPESIPYVQVEQRIKEARKQEKRIWNKLTYNCEHWAREMFKGQPECTQLQRWKEEIRRQKQSEVRSPS